MSTPRNETLTPCNETTCQLCGGALEAKPTGRPRRFCCSTHRVRFHRLRARAEEAESKPTVPAVSAPATQAKRRRGKQDRINALAELATVLEELQPSVHVAGLRRLAERAEELACVLDTIEELAWALDDLDEVACTLENLQQHRPTLDRLRDLDDLANDVEELIRDLREAGRYQEEVEWAVVELEGPDEHEW